MVNRQEEDDENVLLCWSSLCGWCCDESSAWKTEEVKAVSPVSNPDCDVSSDSSDSSPKTSIAETVETFETAIESFSINDMKKTQRVVLEEDDHHDGSSSVDTATFLSTTSSIMDAELAASTSNYVYIKSDEHAWVPARVLQQNDGKAVVSVPLYKDEQAIQSDGGRTARRNDKVTVKLADYPNSALLLQNVDENGLLKEVEDMVDLPFLHEVSERGGRSKAAAHQTHSLYAPLGRHSLQSQDPSHSRKAVYSNGGHSYCLQPLPMVRRSLLGGKATLLCQGFGMGHCGTW